jgi:Rha family phage regulatory protein
MNQIITAQGATMSSLEIAELTGTEHKNVLRKIETMLESMDEISRLNFEPSEYNTERGRIERCYEMNKTGSLVMIASYNVNFLTAVITRWQELEAKIRSNEIYNLLGDQIKIQVKQDYKNEVKKSLQTNNPTSKALIKFMKNEREFAMIHKIEFLEKDLRKLIQACAARGVAL